MLPVAKERRDVGGVEIENKSASRSGVALTFGGVSDSAQWAERGTFSGLVESFRVRRSERVGLGWSIAKCFIFCCDTD